MAYLNKNTFPLRHHWASFSIDRASITVTQLPVELKVRTKNIKSWFNSASGLLLDMDERISRCIISNYKVNSETMEKQESEKL